MSLNVSVCPHAMLGQPRWAYSHARGRGPSQAARGCACGCEPESPRNRAQGGLSPAGFIIERPGAWTVPKAIQSALS